MINLSADMTVIFCGVFNFEAQRREIHQLNQKDFITKRLIEEQRKKTVQLKSCVEHFI